MRTTPFLAILMACGGGDIADDESAVLLYEDFEPTLARIVQAGLDAKGTATDGANIPVIELEGEVSGTLSLDGTVAQSVGENEQLTLDVTLEDYSDTGVLTYDSALAEDGEPLSFC